MMSFLGTRLGEAKVPTSAGKSYNEKLFLSGGSNFVHALHERP
jgi:hypothetical protein